MTVCFPNHLFAHSQNPAASHVLTPLFISQIAAVWQDVRRDVAYRQIQVGKAHRRGEAGLDRRNRFRGSTDRSEAAQEFQVASLDQGN